MTSDLGGNIQPGETAQTGCDKIACQSCTQCIKLGEATKRGAACGNGENSLRGVNIKNQSGTRNSLNSGFLGNVNPHKTFLVYLRCPVDVCVCLPILLLLATVCCLQPWATLRKFCL